MTTLLFLLFFCGETLSQLFQHPLGSFNFFNQPIGYHHALPSGHVNVKFEYPKKVADSFAIKFKPQVAPQVFPVAPQVVQPQTIHATPQSASYGIPVQPQGVKYETVQGPGQLVDPLTSFFASLIGVTSRPTTSQPEAAYGGWRPIQTPPRPESLFTPATGLEDASSLKQVQAYNQALQEVAREGVKQQTSGGIPELDLEGLGFPEISFVK